MNKQATIGGIKLSRIAIHVLFWLVVYGIFTIVYAIKSTYAISARNDLFYLPIHMFYFYSVVYWLIPVYLLRGRYLGFSLILVSLVFTTAMMGRFVDIFIQTPYMLLHQRPLDWTYLDDIKHTFWQRITSAPHFINSLKMNNMVIWFAVGIKLFKLWYERKQVALQAELSALKGQVHPHFLFNTLNNLYALTLNNSPKAPGVVLGLSDMLRYMLYECDTDKVNLKKEVLMLQHYIGLEKIRYEDRLDLSFNIKGELEDKLIAPLLLLPLVENAFKHGTSEKVGEAWININLEVSGTSLKFKISNSKPDAVDGDADKHHGHIGLQNVRKRLELLYPSAYQLKIMDEDEVFLAILEMELNADPSRKATKQPALA